MASPGKRHGKKHLDYDGGRTQIKGARSVSDFCSRALSQMLNSQFDNDPKSTPWRQATMHRRDFLRSTAAAGLALTSNAWVRGGDTKTYRAGLIGTGWYGMVDLRHLMHSGRAE